MVAALPYKCPKAQAAYFAEYRRKNRDRLKDNQRRFFERNPEKRYQYSRATKLKARYGITVPDLEEMLKIQGGRCAICKANSPGARGEGGIKGWCVDHDHTTGAVRGVLCDLCNRGLGYFKDDVERLSSAVEYLKRHS